MIVILSLFAALYVAVAVVLIWLLLPSGMVSPANAMMIGGGLITSVVPQILRRYRLTIVFALLFVGGLVLAFAALVDAGKVFFPWPPQSSHLWLAVAGFAMILTGMTIDATTRSSIWMWESASWGVELTYWRSWVIARRSIMPVLLLLVLLVTPSSSH